MAEIPDYGGGGDTGGGSTTNICTVNPSDNVSIINNLISRISDIEKFLSQLVGADVHADNLSELAENIGNIFNGTITLPSDSNSPYGTGGSIPIPDGFSGTVISGNVTTVWENGVVSFQVDTSGIVTGGGGTTASVFSNLESADDQPISGVQTTLTIDTKDLDNIGLSLGSNAISGFDTGFYLVAANVQVDAGTNYQTVNMNLQINGMDYPIGNQYIINFDSSTYGFNTPFTGNLVGASTISGSVSVRITITSVPTTTCFVRVNSITFIKLT